MANEFKCPKCGKDCKNASGLGSHLRIHKTKVKEEPHQEEQIPQQQQQQQQQKRQYTPRQTRIPITVRWCPQCGLDLHALTIAIAMVKKGGR